MSGRSRSRSSEPGTRARPSCIGFDVAPQEGRRMRSLTLVFAALAIALALGAGPAYAGREQMACVSPGALYALLNAESRHDRREVAHLEGVGCQTLSGLHYEVTGERNGVIEIRVFTREDDWASSRLAYTLDEMLDR